MKHMALFLNNDEARVFHVDPDNFDEQTIEVKSSHVHRHPKDSTTRIHNHPDDEHKFFRELALLLADAEQVLVMGPSVTKVQFVKFVGEHHPALAAKIVAVENADHPSDRQIVAHVREHFHIAPPRRGVER